VVLALVVGEEGVVVVVEVVEVEVLLHHLQPLHIRQLRHQHQPC